MPTINILFMCQLSPAQPTVILNLHVAKTGNLQYVSTHSYKPTAQVIIFMTSSDKTMDFLISIDFFPKQALHTTVINVSSLSTVWNELKQTKTQLKVCLDGRHGSNLNWAELLLSSKRSLKLVRESSIISLEILKIKCDKR